MTPTKIGYIKLPGAGSTHTRASERGYRISFRTFPVDLKPPYISYQHLLFPTSTMRVTEYILTMEACCPVVRTMGKAK